jgi:hypothetical protein
VTVLGWSDGLYPGGPGAARSDPRQIAVTTQIAVDGLRALAAFADRPDDQRLAATRIASGEHRVRADAIVVVVRGQIAAPIEGQVQLGDGVSMCRR